MRLCEETITVFNARPDGDTGSVRYVPTVIAGCSWRRRQRETVDAKGGLVCADECVVRIPVDADFGGKRYADPVAWRQGSAEGYFTIQGGDALVRGSVEGSDWTPARLKAAFADCMIALGVTDNRRAPNGAHWKVVGV